MPKRGVRLICLRPTDRALAHRVNSLLSEHLPQVRHAELLESDELSSLLVFGELIEALIARIDCDGIAVRILDPPVDDGDVRDDLRSVWMSFDAGINAISGVRTHYTKANHFPPGQEARAEKVRHASKDRQGVRRGGRGEGRGANCRGGNTVGGNCGGLPTLPLRFAQACTALIDLGAPVLLSVVWASRARRTLRVHRLHHFSETVYFSNCKFSYP